MEQSASTLGSITSQCPRTGPRLLIGCKSSDHHCVSRTFYISFTEGKKARSDPSCVRYCLVMQAD